MNAIDFLAGARMLQQANDLDEVTALHYMQKIGDTLEIDENGLVIVRDEAGIELARVLFPDEECFPVACATFVAAIQLRKLSEFQDAHGRPPESEEANAIAREAAKYGTKIESARIIMRDGRVAPVIRMGGRCFGIETKPSILALGIVAMHPLSENFEDDFNAPQFFTATVPADPADGRLEPLHLDNFTTIPAIVDLARKFAVLTANGTAVEGPLA